MDKLINVVISLLFVLFIIFVFAFLFAFITRFAWAHSFAQIFNLPELTYWQAYWLNVLGGMLCKSSSTSSST